MRLALLACTLLLAGVCAAQDGNRQEPITTLKLETRVVAISASVNDAAGKAVGGLSRDDFDVKQDGKPVELRYFSQGAEEPLTLTLMVDTSGSQKTFIPDETEASMVFFRAMLTGREDRAALVQFDDNVIPLQPLTHDVDKLQRQLGYLSYPHKSLFAPGQTGTLLYKAIKVAAERMLTGQQGRRAMVILTDGEDNGSPEKLDDAIAAALKSDVVVYAVEYSANAYMGGLGAPAPSDGGRVVLEKLSGATGGKVFAVSARTGLREIFAEIGEDLRLQYELGYRAPDDAAGTYHKLEVKVKARKLKVLARKGFYTPAR